MNRKFFIFPKFLCGFFQISEEGFLPNFKTNSMEFDFIGFLGKLAFQGYLICIFLSKSDPSIYLFTNYS